MNRKEFYAKVLVLVDRRDLVANKHIVRSLCPLQREPFLYALRTGCKIPEAKHASEILFNLTRSTALSLSDIFEMLPRVHRLLTIMEIIK